MAIFDSKIELQSRSIADYPQPFITYNNLIATPSYIQGDYYYYYQFGATTSTSSIIFNRDTLCDILIVGGGGAGYQSVGGGGTAGNIIYARNVPILADTTYPISVGGGGTSGFDGGNTIAFGCTVSGGKQAIDLNGGLANVANTISALINSGTEISNGLALGGGNGFLASITATFTTAPVAGGSTNVSYTQVNGNPQYYYYAFTQSGSITFPNDTVCDILIVGGGGSGGGLVGCGGGGGGVVYIKGKNMSGTYTIGVGGRTGNTTAGKNISGNESFIKSGTTYVTHTNDSSTFELKALGGGGGGYYDGFNGLSGGSGGGGYKHTNAPSAVGGTATQGNTLWNESTNSFVAGGSAGKVNTTTGSIAGGGGGIGVVSSGDPINKGTAGKTINITGNNVIYGAGGGGYPEGNHGDSTNGGKAGKEGASFKPTATLENMGYGGNGSGFNGSENGNNSGGSGVVIIQVPATFIADVRGGGGGGIGDTGDNATNLLVGAGGDGFTSTITGSLYTYSQGGYGAKTGVADTTLTVNIGSGGDGRIGSTGEKGGDGTVIVRWRATPVETVGTRSVVATLDNIPVYTAGYGIALSNTNTISSTMVNISGHLVLPSGKRIYNSQGHDLSTWQLINAHTYVRTVSSGVYEHKILLSSLPYEEYATSTSVSGDRKRRIFEVTILSKSFDWTSVSFVNSKTTFYRGATNYKQSNGFTGSGINPNPTMTETGSPDQILFTASSGNPDNYTTYVKLIYPFNGLLVETSPAIM